MLWGHVYDKRDREIEIQRERKRERDREIEIQRERKREREREIVRRKWPPLIYIHLCFESEFVSFESGDLRYLMKCCLLMKTHGSHVYLSQPCFLKLLKPPVLYFYCKPSIMFTPENSYIVGSSTKLQHTLTYTLIGA